MSSADQPSAPEPIGPHHQIAGFDCGEEALNGYLRKFALANHQAGYARTFVSCDTEGRVLGYYTLTASQVLHERASERLSKGAARHPIPVALLARLAVDKSAQGRRLGQSLLLDAIRRVLDASESMGIRALLVHAKHERAAAFYSKHAGFAPLPGDPLALYLLLKDARRSWTSSMRDAVASARIRSRRPPAGRCQSRPAGFGDPALQWLQSML